MTKELVGTYELPKREIKFRAWDTRNKQWYSPTHEAYKGDLRELLINFSGQLSAHTMQGLEHESLWKDRYILMQYTGLKDKNGIEIYGGDLLENCGDNTPSLVSFKNGCYYVGEYNTMLIEYSGDNKKVVGNIFENPELLEA